MFGLVSLLMLYLRAFVLWLLMHPQFVLLAFFLLTFVLFVTRKKWRKKKPFLPWIALSAFIGYVLIFILYFDRIDLFNPSSTNNSAETLAATSQADDQSYCFGIDVSQYQGKINWEELKSTKHPLRFVIARATMGSDGQDKQFISNWSALKKMGLKKGAYHYYRPSENSLVQAKNFIARVDLQSGDLPPVLDIEELSPLGVSNLRKGIRNWLQIVEKHYHCKPIVYTGRIFYEKYLFGYIDSYPLWIATYGPESRVSHLSWNFFQFSDQMIVRGINTEVDGNFFKGSLTKLRNFGL